MPEQLTKHPEVTLQVLRSAGARCGADAVAAPAILAQCPPERFCRLPGGELCVYGLADAPRMTQLDAADWRTLQAATAPPQPADAGIGWIGAAAGLLVGALVGAALAWRGRSRRAPPPAT